MEFVLFAQKCIMVYTMCVVLGSTMCVVLVLLNIGVNRGLAQ